MAEQLTELDLISALPDDLLHRIGSVLPLDEAIKTSILSSRWRSLWTPSQLNFTILQDSTSATTTKNSAKVLIDTFLASYEVPETRKLCFSCSDDKANEMTIMAIKGVDKELHLQFSQQTEIVKPKGFRLKLEPAPYSANLAALRTLHLRSVTSQLGGCFVSALFSGCRLLETLTLEKCSGLESVEIEKNSDLRSLTIYDCMSLENVSVSAMEMTSFSYRGVLPRIELKNCSNLSEVELDLTGSEPQLGEFDCEEVLSLFAAMKEIEKLTISGWLLEWLCAGGVIYERLEFKFENLKELTWIDASMNISKRDSIACFLNICPILTNLVVNIDRSRVSVDRPLFHSYWHEPHLWMDYAAVKANVQPLKHLRSVRISGFFDGTVDEDENQFCLMDLLLEKAMGSIESMSLSSSD